MLQNLLQEFYITVEKTLFFFSVLYGTFKCLGFKKRLVLSVPAVVNPHMHMLTHKPTPTHIHSLSLARSQNLRAA